MNRTSTQTSLIITTSLSLILIGLFIYIDKDKIEKNYLSGALKYKEEIISEKNTCNYLNYWHDSNYISSEFLNNSFGTSSLYLEPEIYNELSDASICMRDRIFIINSQNNLTLDANNINEIIDEIFLSANFSLASLKSMKNTSRDIIINQDITFSKP